MCRVGFAFAVGTVFIALAPVHAGLARPPELYAQPSGRPLRGGDGDLLLLAGAGLDANSTVVYRQASSHDAQLVPAGVAPGTNTAVTGRLDVVSALDAPQSLVVRLPSEFQAGTRYVAWVRNSQGEWSGAVRINEPVGRWITPGVVYATRMPGNLPRELRLVGRNLEGVGEMQAHIRLSGPRIIELSASPAGGSGSKLGRFVFTAPLPPRLVPGVYRVAFTRDDGVSSDVDAPSLVVLPDPVAQREVRVGDYGCVPGAQADATRCVVAAIAQAAKTGARVAFGPGAWRLADPAVEGVTGDGIVVPRGVAIIGSGAQLTTLVRSEQWGRRRPAFSLDGENVFADLRATDEVRYSDHEGSSFLQVGRTFTAGGAPVVHDVTVTGVVFDRTFSAMGDGGRPIDGLYVTHNVFGSYAYGLLLEGNGGNVAQRFAISDAVFRFNTFYPGSLFDRRSALGPIASQIGAAQRMDFSDNLADGSVTAYLYDATHDPRGWRAAFFFALRGNEEHVLIAANTITCPGDKAGDGEAIVFDNNHNAPGLDQAMAVHGATATTFALEAKDSLRESFEGARLPADYFVGHYAEIVGGSGKGQVRKIVGYDSFDGLVARIFPRWEVIPDQTSRIVVARAANDVAIVGNHVDQRAPLCTKSNVTRPSGGVISFYANTIDSVIENNALFDTSGVFLAHQYIVRDASHADPEVMFEYGVDVRGNLIDGEFQWSSDRSWSGVEIGYAASPVPGLAPATGAFATTIAHNRIVHADGMGGGAISAVPTWYEGPGPLPHVWPFVESPLVFGNHLVDLDGAPARTVDARQGAPIATRRIGIKLSDELVWHTVLTGNSCERVGKPLVDQGHDSVMICDERQPDSCECR